MTSEAWARFFISNSDQLSNVPDFDETTKSQGILGLVGTSTLPKTNIHPLKLLVVFSIFQEGGRYPLVMQQVYGIRNPSGLLEGKHGVHESCLAW